MNSLEPGLQAVMQRRLRRVSRRRQALRRSGGQALVEFALIAPLFLILLFGVVEYSLINASIGAFNFAAKEGARYDAIVGNGASPGGIPLDQYMVNNIIVPRVSGVVMAQMSKVVVYKADETGACFSGGTVPNCSVQDVLQKVGGTWQSTCGASCWLWTSRNDNLSNADYLGVSISYSYTYLTAFFAVTSPTLNLSAISVQRIEPQQYGERDTPATTAIAATGSSWGSLPFSHLLTSLSFAAILPRRDSTDLASHLAGVRA